MNWINLVGLIIVVLILIPNIIYACNNLDLENKCKNKLVNISEQIGRYASMFFMVFSVGLYVLGFNSNEHFAVWLVSISGLIFSVSHIYVTYQNHKAELK